MAYKQKSKDISGLMMKMKSPLNYGDGDEKEKLKAKADEKGWSEKKQVRKGIIQDPTEELPQGWKGVWKKGEYVGAKEKVSIGGLFGDGGKVPTTPGTPTSERKQDIDISIKKKDFKPSEGPSKSKYLRGGKFFTKKKVGRRGGAKKNIRGYSKFK